MSDEDDTDDDIAYVGDDDDRRGAGCLIGFAFLAAGLGAILAVTVWTVLLVNGSLTREAVWDPTSFFVGVGGTIAGILAGGLAIGLGLFASLMPHASTNPLRYQRLGLLAVAIGVVPIASTAILVMVLVAMK